MGTPNSAGRIPLRIDAGLDLALLVALVALMIVKASDTIVVLAFLLGSAVRRRLLRAAHRRCARTDRSHDPLTSLDPHHALGDDEHQAGERRTVAGPRSRKPQLNSPARARAGRQASH